MSPTKQEAKLALLQGKACDKYDYLIAVGCGAIAGLIDIFLVNSPGDSVLGNWSDAQIDKVVMAFAKHSGWKGDNIASAIGYLERTFPVNYDQRHTVEVGGAFQLSTKNHHLKSLAHSPDPIGLFFSILDQFQEKSSFLSGGQLIRIDTSNNRFELRGETFQAKIFAGFCNWLGHIMSDVAGSSGCRGNVGRGSGIGIPFYELFQLCDIGQIQIGKDRQSFSTLMIRVFQEGYDARFGLAMTIPVLFTELFIRTAWALKCHYYHGVEWSKCIPSNQHSDLRCMLLIGTTTLCIFDGVDAAIRSGGNPIAFIMRLNLIAWFKLALMVLKELIIRYNFTYEDLKFQLQHINTALEDYLTKLKAIDYTTYEQELLEVQNIRHMLTDDCTKTTQIYAYFSAVGIETQFHSFEEMDQKMQDDNFVLEI